MRLIDADKIRFKDISDGRVPNGIWYCLLDDIKSQPTVKAIPVKWIEKKCRELFEHLYLDESLGVQRLLRDWEKENENRKGEEEK